MKTSQPLLIVVAIACLSGCIVVGTPAHPLPASLPPGTHAVQTQELEADKTVVMSSIMDVLQDLGFVLETVDPDAGFITASSPQQGPSLLQPRLLINGEPVIATLQNHATAVIEELRPGVVSVRLNFVVSKRHDGETFTTSRDETVLDPQTYQSTFDMIRAAIAARVQPSGRLEEPAAEPPGQGGDQRGGGDGDHPR
jgi:hypothetical protein